ncbi:MAG: tetratricopeptide repeat protein [Aggregatilineales bacterium]
MDQSRAFTPPNAPIKEAKLLPTQPPTHMLGRNRELASSHIALKAGTAIFLHGPAGIGKTAIAAVLATAYTAENLGGVLWFTLAEDDADLLLARVGRAYGVNALTEQQAPSERAKVVRALLERNRPLIVLDGLADPNAIRDFVRNVGAGLPLIVTDTVPAAGPWTPIPIAPLSDTASAELLQVYGDLSDETDASDVDSLCHILNGDPLALILAGRHLVAEQLTPAELLTALLAAVPVGASKPDPQQTILAVIYKKLTPIGQGIFLALGALFTNSAGAELIADLSTMTAAQLTPVMRQLTAHGLVQESVSYGQTRYTLHESVQAYAHRILESSRRLSAIEGRALQSVLAYTSRHAGLDTADHDRLAAEMDNIVNAAAFATSIGQDAPVRQLLQALTQQSGDFVNLRGYQPEVGQLRKLLSMLNRTESGSWVFTESDTPEPDMDATLTQDWAAFQSAGPGTTLPDWTVVEEAASQINPPPDSELTEAATLGVPIPEPPITPDATRMIRPVTAYQPSPNHVHDIHTPQPPGRLPQPSAPDTTQPAVPAADATFADTPVRASITPDTLPFPRPVTTYTPAPEHVRDPHSPQLSGLSTDTTQNAVPTPDTFESTAAAPVTVEDTGTAPVPPHMPEVELYIANRAAPTDQTNKTVAVPAPTMPTPALTPTPATPPISAHPSAETPAGKLSIGELQTRVEDARLSGDKNALANYLEQLGDWYVADQDRARAITAYMQAVEALRPGEEWGKIGLVMEKLGRTYVSAGQPMEAAHVLEQTAPMFHTANRPVDEARVFEALGNVYDALYDWPNAQHYHEQALTAARAQNNEHSEAAQLGSLAYVHEMQGHTDDAVQRYRQGLHLAYTIGDNELSGEYAYRLGRLLLGDGRTLNQAVSLLDEAATRLPGDSDVQRLLKRGRTRLEHLHTSGIAIPDALANVDYAASDYADAPHTAPVS